MASRGSSAVVSRRGGGRGDNQHNPPPTDALHTPRARPGHRRTRSSGTPKRESWRSGSPKTGSPRDRATARRPELLRGESNRGLLSDKGAELIRRQQRRSPGGSRHVSPPRNGTVLPGGVVSTPGHPGGGGGSRASRTPPSAGPHPSLLPGIGEAVSPAPSAVPSPRSSAGRRTRAGTGDSTASASGPASPALTPVPSKRRASVAGLSSWSRAAARLPQKVEFSDGDHVSVDVGGNSLAGTVRYVGTTDFAPGTWVGVQLVHAEGRNNGSVRGRTYFICRKNCGVFVRPAAVRSFHDTLRDDPDGADLRARIRDEITGGGAGGSPSQSDGPASGTTAPPSNGSAVSGRSSANGDSTFTVYNRKRARRHSLASIHSFHAFAGGLDLGVGGRASGGVAAGGLSTIVDLDGSGAMADGRDASGGRRSPGYKLDSEGRIEKLSRDIILNGDGSENPFSLVSLRSFYANWQGGAWEVPPGLADETVNDPHFRDLEELLTKSYSTSSESSGDGSTSYSTATRQSGGSEDRSDGGGGGATTSGIDAIDSGTATTASAVTPKAIEGLGTLSSGTSTPRGTRKGPLAPSVSLPVLPQVVLDIDELSTSVMSARMRTSGGATPRGTVSAGGGGGGGSGGSGPASLLRSLLKPGSGDADSAGDGVAEPAAATRPRSSTLFRTKTPAQKEKEALERAAAVREEVEGEAVIHEGLLRKSSGKKKLKRWDGRWFVLTAEELRYYDPKHRTTLKGAIPLAQIEDVHDTLVDAAIKQRKGAFDVVTLERRFTLYGETTAESIAWRDLIISTVWPNGSHGLVDRTTGARLAGVLQEGTLFHFNPQKRKRWESKYFILTRHHLRIYPSRSTMVIAIGKIYVGDIRTIGSSPSRAALTHYPHAFAVSTDRLTYTLAGATRSESHAWMSALRAIVDAGRAAAIAAAAAAATAKPEIGTSKARANASGSSDVSLESTDVGSSPGSSGSLEFVGEDASDGPSRPSIPLGRHKSSDDGDAVQSPRSQPGQGAESDPTPLRPADGSAPLADRRSQSAELLSRNRVAAALAASATAGSGESGRGSIRPRSLSDSRGSVSTSLGGVGSESLYRLTLRKQLSAGPVSGGKAGLAGQAQSERDPDGAAAHDNWEDEFVVSSESGDGASAEDSLLFASTVSASVSDEAEATLSFEVVMKRWFATAPEIDSSPRPKVVVEFLRLLRTLRASLATVRTGRLGRQRGVRLVDLANYLLAHGMKRRTHAHLLIGKMIEYGLLTPTRLSQRDAPVSDSRNVWGLFSSRPLEAVVIFNTPSGASDAAPAMFGVSFANLNMEEVMDAPYAQRTSAVLVGMAGHAGGFFSPAQRDVFAGHVLRWMRKSEDQQITELPWAEANRHNPIAFRATVGDVCQALRVFADLYLKPFPRVDGRKDADIAHTLHINATSVREFPSVLFSLVAVVSDVHCFSRPSAFGGAIDGSGPVPGLAGVAAAFVRVTLTELDLSGNGSLQRLPIGIGELTSLERLNLSGCSSLTEFPSSIGALGRLHTLNISACRLLDPKTCLSLVNLGELDITGSAMETLTWVMFFPRLDVLHAKRLPDITHVAPELWATTQVTADARHLHRTTLLADGVVGLRVSTGLSAALTGAAFVLSLLTFVLGLALGSQASRVMVAAVLAAALAVMLAAVGAGAALALPWPSMWAGDGRRFESPLLGRYDDEAPGEDKTWINARMSDELQRRRELVSRPRARLLPMAATLVQTLQVMCLVGHGGLPWPVPFGRFLRFAGGLQTNAFAEFCAVFAVALVLAAASRFTVEMGTYSKRERRQRAVDTFVGAVVPFFFVPLWWTVFGGLRCAGTTGEWLTRGLLSSDAGTTGRLCWEGSHFIIVGFTMVAAVACGPTLILTQPMYAIRLRLATELRPEAAAVRSAIIFVLLAGYNIIPSADGFLAFFVCTALLLCLLSGRDVYNARRAVPVAGAGMGAAAAAAAVGATSYEGGWLRVGCDLLLVCVALVGVWLRIIDDPASAAPAQAAQIVIMIAAGVITAYAVNVVRNGAAGPPVLRDHKPLASSAAPMASGGEGEGDHSVPPQDDVGLGGSGVFGAGGGSGDAGGPAAADRV